MDIANLTKSANLNEGQWVGDLPEMGDIRFKVRSTGFKPYKVAVAGLARRTGKKLRTDEGVIDFAVTTGKALAEHILLDWEGVTDGGKPLKYDAKKALAILTADDDFGIGEAYRKAVEWAGDRLAEQIKDQATEAAGN
jgi:hypothetical protein